MKTALELLGDDLITVGLAAAHDIGRAMQMLELAVTRAREEMREMAARVVEDIEEHTDDYDLRKGVGPRAIRELPVTR